MKLLALLLGISCAWGCTQPRSARCKDVCRREAECVDQTGNKIPFEEKECVAACAVLEADVADNGAKVQNHVDCVARQQSCSGVLDCQ